MYTRLYRPPEVIFCKPDYTFTSDVWSIGCILAECIKLIDYENKKNPIKFDKPEDRYLFPGKSCYPLSMKHYEKDKKNSTVTVSKNDLLAKIMSVLGGDLDTSFLNES